MKTINYSRLIFSILLMLGLWTMNVNAQAPYCAPSSVNGGTIGDEITLLQSAAMGWNYSNSVQTPSPGYLDRTSITGIVGVAGTTYTVTVNQQDASDAVRIWIDMNNNNSLEDANELVFSNPTPILGSNPISFTIPATCPAGAHRMRVRNTYNPTNAISTITSCITGITYGVSIDFTINTSVAAACVTPTASPTVLVLTPASPVQINGSFTAASPAADGYLVVRYLTGSVPTSPVDGTTYSAGNALGSGVVVQSSSALSFSAAGLSGSTTYDFYVYSFNSACTGGPLYKGAAALTGTATTLSCTPAAQPTGLTLTPVANTANISGSFAASSPASNGYLVVRYLSGAIPTDPVNGTTYSSGGALGTGTVVQSSSALSFTATGMAATTAYDFYIYSFTTVCSGGPFYNVTGPLMGTATTLTPTMTKYIVSKITGQTYSTLSGGGITTINTNAGLTAGFGDGTQNDGGILVTLPFTFNYNGNSFTQMTMSANGWIGCGNQTTVTTAQSITNGSLFTTAVPNNTIAPWWKDMGANFPIGVGSLRHGLVGTDIYAFQWDKAVGSGTADNSIIWISFMAKIYGPASSNPGRIEFIYGPKTGAITFAAAVGIEDALGGTNHYINAMSNSGLFSFNGGAINGTTTSTAWPGNGNGYRFDPIATSCPGTPANQPTVLNLTSITGTQVNGSFTAAASIPNAYLVVRYNAGAAVTAPVNGTSYAVGAVLGLGTVVVTEAATSFSATGLTANTGYDFYVYSVCADGPTYLTASPLMASITTITNAVPICAPVYDPANGETDVRLNQVLAWSGAIGSPAVSGYDVYFSTNLSLVTSQSVLARVAVNQAATTFTPANAFPNVALGPNTTYYWEVIPRSTFGSVTPCVINSFTTHAAAAFTANAIGGLWSSPATWSGGNIPQQGDDVVIPDGVIVTVDVSGINIRNLTIGGGTSGILQWNATANTINIIGNVLINSGAKLLAYTTGQIGVTINVGGDFTNNGFANLALGSALLNFNGSQVGGSMSQTLGGSGTFVADQSGRGLIRALAFQTLGSSSISTAQNLVTTSFIHTAGSLNTNGKLAIDNTAQVYGQALNLQVANVVVTGMGTAYSAAPVVYGTSVSPYPASGNALTAGISYFSGGNVYLCTVSGTSNGVAPTDVAPPTFTTSGGTLLWIAPLGTLGNPFNITASGLVLGTQYFYGGNLYVATATTTGSASSPPTHTSGIVANMLYVGTPAIISSVNFDSPTQTVRSLTLGANGSGYSSAPSLAFSIGVIGGTVTTAATASVVYVQQIIGPLNSLTQKTPQATISGGLNIKSDQSVGGITTTSGGVNYSAAPSVGFSLPIGFRNLVISQGTGYTSAPTVTVSGGTALTGFTNPTFTVTVASGKVVSVICTGGGTLWTSPPTLTLTGGGFTSQATCAFPAGCLATATATIGGNGQVTNFTVTNGGFDYVSAPTVGLVTNGTVTTAATAPTCRIGLYNLTLGTFTPSNIFTPGTYAEGAEIPSNRRINIYTLGASTTNPVFTNTYSANLELYNAAPLVLNNGTMDMGANTLICSHPSYAGQAGTLTASVKGMVTLSSPGGSVTRTFPFEVGLPVITGTGSVTTGSTITTLTAQITGAPTGTGVIGTRSFYVTSNGGVYGTNPQVTLNWNANDALNSDQSSLFIAQATSTSGPWATRSLTSGTVNGALATTGSRTTATTSPGPIVPTGTDYFAWVTTFNATPLSYNIVRTTGNAFNSIISTGNVYGWPASTSDDDATSPLISIPSSTFQYQGQTITGFKVCTNGWAQLVSSFVTPTTATSFSNTLGASGIPNIIAPFWDDLTTNPNAADAANTNLNAETRYQIIGSTPGTRQIVMEWNNYTVFNAAGPSLVFQIVLDETDNSIKFNYGLFQGFNGTNNNRYTYSCGIGGLVVSGFPLAGQLLAQQYENTTAFSNGFATQISVGANGLMSMPECNSSIKFTPGNYAGFTVPAETPPVNDDPAGAILVPALSAFPSNLCGNFYTSRFATPSAQAVCAGVADDDVWFKFIANDPAPIVRVYGSGGYIARVQVFDASLTPIAGVNCVVGTSGSQVSAALSGLTIGNLYYIRVYHDGGGEQATATAIVNNGAVTGTISTKPGTGYGATTSGGVTTARVRFTGGGGTDAVGTAVLGGGGITSVTLNSGGYGYTSVPTITIEKPNWAHIGEFALVVFAVAANDNCATATNLTGLATPGCNVAANAYAGVTTASATASSEAACTGVPDDDVWYKFTAVNTNTSIGVQGHNTYNPAVQIFDGGVSPGDCNTKTSIQCLDLTGAGGAEGILLPTTVGNTYFIRVYHSASGPGVPGDNFDICVSSAPPACVTAITPVNGGNSCTAGTTLSWTSSLGASGYDVYLDNVLVSSNQPGTTFNAGSLALGPHSWNIQPRNIFGANSACSNFTFNVFATPTVSVAPNPATICIGSSVGLSATGADTYTWSPVSGLSSSTGASVTANPTSTTIYNITGTVTATGCANTTTAQVNVVTPPVVASVTANPTATCVGGTSVLTVNASTGIPPSGYCAATNLGSSCVSLVTLNTLNFNFPAGGPACTAANFYNNNAPTGANTTDLTPGNSYTITINTTGTAIVSVWIDFNRDGIYDASEWVQPYISASSGTAIIIVPFGASPGPTGMRVRSRLNGNQNGSGDACLAMGSGSTEDFTVNIVGGALSYAWSVFSGPGGLSSTTTNPTTGTNITSSTTYNVAVSNIACTSTGSVTVAPGGPLSTTVAATPPSAASAYCVPNYTSYDGTDYISNVTLNGSPAINNTSGSTPLPGYSPFLGISTTLAAGSSYTISVTDGSFSSNENLTAFIDYNQDGVFDPTSEQILPNYVTTVAFETTTATFIVPATALNGTTRLRVVDNYFTTPAPPCPTAGYGETEDYTINITGGITPSALVCPGLPWTLSATPTGGGLPYSYLWSGDPAATAGLVTNNTATVTAIPLAPTTYTVVVTDNCGITTTQSFFVDVRVTNPTIGTVTASSSAGCGVTPAPPNISGAPVTFSVDAFTGDNLIWQFNVNGGAWTTIPGAITTPVSLVPTIAQGGGVVVFGLRAQSYFCAINPATSNAVTFTMDDPAAPTAVTGGARCGPGIVPVSASVPSGQTVEWYTAATGGTLLGTGSSFNYSATASTTIYAADRNPATGCLGSLRIAASITVNTIPTVTASSNSPVCTPNAINLTATPGSAPSPGGSFFNYTTTAGANFFPFGVSGKEVQWFVAPGEFSTPTAAPAGSITSISFYAGATGTTTFNTFTIKLGQTSSAYGGGDLYSGPLTTVISQPSTTITTTIGTWFTLTLETPFAYDPGQWLVVDVSQCSFTGTGFTVYQNTLTGVRRVWSVGGCPFAWFGNDANLPGITIQMAPQTFGYAWTGPNSFSSFDQNPVISPSALNQEGAYTVTITDGGTGCNSSASTSVVVNTAPAITTLQSATLNGGATTTIPAPPTFLNIPVFTTATTCDKVVNYNVGITGKPNPAEAVGGITYSFSGATTGSGNGTGTGSTFGRAIPNGTTFVTVNTTNVCGSLSKQFRVTVTDNVPPVITPIQVSATNTNGGNCSSLVQVTQPSQGNGMFDNCPNANLVWVSRSDGRPQFDPYFAGTTTVTWEATDASGNTSTATQNVVVTNIKPVITSLTAAAGNVIFAGQSTTFTAVFTDEDGGGPHTIKFYRDKNDATPANTKTLSASCTQSCSGVRSYSVTSDPITFSTSEVVEPKVEVLDGCNQAADQVPGTTTFQYLAVAVAGTQFTTAGGHFVLQPGTYPSSYAGLGVNIGNVVKPGNGNNYKGQLEMNVHLTNTTNWRVHTDNGSNTDITWDYLVVSGCTLATYKGSVLINGVSGYKVLVQQADKNANPSTSNFIRVKVSTNGGVLVFDTQPGLTEALTSGNGGAAAIVTALDGGSVTVHPNNGCVARIDDKTADGLMQNIPNPFNSNTEIRFSVPEDGKYTLKVYNYLGQIVANLFDDNATSGTVYSVMFDGSNLGEGIYTYTLSGVNLNETLRMNLIR